MTAVLKAVLDTMLPGGSGFPTGSATGSVEWLQAQARFREPLAALLAQLPADFGGGTTEIRTEALKAIVRDAPEVFDAATVAIYSAYYTRPEVLAAVEAARGYKAQPPQPGGYALPAFNPDILAVPKSRASLWRDPETEASQ